MRAGSAVLFVILMFLTVPAYADFQPQQWQYFKQVVAEKDGFALIELDPEALNHCRDNFSDLRIVSGQDRETPYQAIKLEPPKEENYPAQLINRVTRENEYTLVTLDLGKAGSLHNHARVELEQEHKGDYLREVNIEGSNDNQTWFFISRNRVFYVSPDNRQSDLFYPPATFQYIRLKIDCKGTEPLFVKDVRVSFKPVENSAASLLPGKVLSNNTDPKTNKTELIIELGAKGYQVNRVDFQINGQNFNRPVELYDRVDGSEWKLICSDRVYQYKWPDYESLKNSVTVNRQIGNQLKVLINNQDSLPLDISGVEVRGEVPRLLADLQAGNYFLWYGNPESKEPRYDLSGFSHLIDKSKLAVIQPGAEAKNEKYEKARLPIRWALNGITIFTALILGIIIIKNMKSRANQ